MRKWYLLLTIISFSFLLNTLAQRGKIAGTITDAGTGEPLIGVNVIVEGSGQGAATDIDGYYVILNVSPGKKSVIVSYIGYTSKNITDVVVNIDQTTIIDVELSTQSVETDEVVVTAAIIPIVEQDVAASRANISSEEIENLPTTSVERIAALHLEVRKLDQCLWLGL